MDKKECLCVFFKENIYLLPGNIGGPTQVRYCAFIIYRSAHGPPILKRSDPSGPNPATVSLSCAVIITVTIIKHCLWTGSRLKYCWFVEFSYTLI